MNHSPPPPPPSGQGGGSRTISSDGDLSRGMPVGKGNVLNHRGNGAAGEIFENERMNPLTLPKNVIKKLPFLSIILFPYLRINFMERYPIFYKFSQISSPYVRTSFSFESVRNEIKIKIS